MNSFLILYYRILTLDPWTSATQRFPSVSIVIPSGNPCKLLSFTSMTILLFAKFKVELNKIFKIFSTLTFFKMKYFTYRYFQSSDQNRKLQLCSSKYLCNRVFYYPCSKLTHCLSKPERESFEYLAFYPKSREFHALVYFSDQSDT